MPCVVFTDSKLFQAHVQPQSTFESRSSYSNQRGDYQNQSQDYPSQHDYNRQQNIVPSSHVSHGSSRSVGPDTKQGTGSEARGLLDARKSLSQAMSDSRGGQDRYQGSIERSQGPRSNPDFRDSNRGPLAPPTLRPVSMDVRAHAAQDSRAHPLDSASLGLRGQDELSYHEPTNPEPLNCQPQWNTGANDQWSAQTRVQNSNTGYNYQHPIAQVNPGYGSQVSINGFFWL